MTKFIIKKTPKGTFTFRLFASNGEKIIVSTQPYTTKASAKKGIESIIKNSERAIKENKISDITGKQKSDITFPKFEVYKDKQGLFRFRLYALNGESIAQCEKGYTTKAMCVKGCNSLFSTSKTATIEDE